jgi:hypothetical protein
MSTAGVRSSGRESSRTVRGFAQPRRWPRRHPRLTTALVVVLVGGLTSTLLAILHPWNKCGPGMRPVGSPYRCIGLNLQ